MLLDAYLTDRAIELESARHEIAYEFIVDKNATLIDTDAIYLTGVVLVAGEISAHKLKEIPDPKGSFLAPVSTITARVKKLADIKQVQHYEVPMYVQAFGNWIDEEDRDTSLLDGVSQNFVWMIPMPTALETDLLKRYGSSLFCKVPDQLI
jgi:hypothetical protein